jgi:hypothetical protein
MHRDRLRSLTPAAAGPEEPSPNDPLAQDRGHWQRAPTRLRRRQRRDHLACRNGRPATFESGVDGAAAGARGITIAAHGARRQQAEHLPPTPTRELPQSQGSSQPANLLGKLGRDRGITCSRRRSGLLASPHLGVLAAAGEELVMAAVLDHAAGLEHQDLVAIERGRAAVRDDQRGAPRGQAPGRRRRVSPAPLARR